MEETNFNYFKIDVPGKYGYSFLVGTKFNETEETIIGIVYDCGLFDYAEDYEIASAERVKRGDYDFQHLKDTLVYLDGE